jgi:spore germination protein GerM
MEKKITIIVGILVVVVAVISIFIATHAEVTEYTPESEIENSDLRKTIISLYFADAETNELKIETRLIDSKELLKNPYKTLIEILISGSENSSYKTLIPENTKVLGTKLNGECLTVNLSEEFLANLGESMEKINSIYQIVNTVTELTEVNSVKFLINGEEVEGFSEIGISLKCEFVRTE